MRDDQYLEAITRESAALADAARLAGLDAPVPTCPGWTVADLLEHMGNVQRWAARTVATRPAERISRRDMSEAPPRAELLAWFHAAGRELVTTLAAADPAAPVWTFGPDGTVRFWFRRQAHEVTVHRVDAERAAGRPAAPIAPDLAADGIDEWLGFAAAFGHDALRGEGETVHLHCTDTADGELGEWLLTLRPDGPGLERVHAKGDVAARGAASDLDLFVAGRVGVDALEVFGDGALLERVVRGFTL